MLIQIAEGIQKRLMDSLLFVMVEYYEGQLEDLVNFIINPPAVYIEVKRGVKAEETHSKPTIYINLFILTSHMKGNENNSMYELIDALFDTLHDTPLLDLDSNYVGRLFFEDFDRLGIVPGFNIYSLSFSLVV